MLTVSNAWLLDEADRVEGAARTTWLVLGTADHYGAEIEKA